MKTKFLSIALLALGLFSCANSAKQGEVEDVDSFETAVMQVVDGFKSKDAAKINELVGDAGVTVIYRPGAIDAIETISKFNFEKPVPEVFPYGEIKSEANLKYEVLPTFSCETEKWSKEAGLYSDTVSIDKKLSSMVRFFLDNEMAEDRAVTEDTFIKFDGMEKDTRRVVLIGDNGESLVFYLTKKDNKWLFTILDRVSDDCGA